MSEGDGRAPRPARGVPSLTVGLLIMLTVGLTGSIAVGKSYVLGVLRELGCQTFDADKIAHELILPGRAGYQPVIEAFGNAVLGQRGKIDRAKLGAIVFTDPAARQKLNSILHPLVINEQDRILSETCKYHPDCIAVVDAALIIESGSYKRFDKLIVVYCDEEVQLERLMNRSALTRGQALARISSQMPSSEKRKYADYEIDTTAGFEATRKQVEALYHELEQLRDSMNSRFRNDTA